ncbi:MAG: 30S ribosomal protein S11 [Candidatus Colwellbacteria bacterium CG10_big_fil_rev_8_21_14_0_10_41_28]|uniref:Small ribosomal subunit protein uS11 n=1 Tax=Candidatus Colwellbacteria bacterium CG10_big_fil_rev_8_21_14_0_10_41_28 TaxID=1974539 RepID=A0A2H0VHT3_9BACT|nr:MAG: 30S ribosomal protein S11 [Candidatus Colwellbacteria bacterium CG10_big_fil_rev_8_21_14_0_10_41_28]
MGKKKIADKGADGSAKKASQSVPKKRGKRAARKIEEGRIYINSSYNNTVLTVTDENGDVIAWSSAGSMGFAGPKKATPFAASKVVAGIVEKLSKNGPNKIHIYASGIGPGRDGAIRSLVASGFELLSIKDITPIAHNGPRPRKQRRN